MSTGHQGTAPIRLGIIGCGNVLGAYRMAIDRCRSSGVLSVQVACGRDHQRDSVLSSLHPARFTTNAADVIAAPDVDLVLILTPMTEHARMVMAALEAGKHVLVEKPLATTLEEGRAILDAARGSPGYLLCAPFTVLSPTFHAMARSIRSGAIGKPCSARARYGWSGPDWNEWFYKAGGGCLFDLGVYCITTLTGLLGPVKRVISLTGVAIDKREIRGETICVEAEDNAQVLLDFGGSTFASVTTGFTLQRYRSPAVEVYGTQGTIQMLGDDWDPDGYELWENASGCWKTFPESAPDWHWTDGLDHLVACIRSRTAPFVTPDHALHVLDILLKAQLAGREGRVIDLETSFPPLTLADRPSGPAAHLRHDPTRGH